MSKIKKSTNILTKLTTEELLKEVSERFLEYKKVNDEKIDFYDRVTETDNWMEMAEVAKVLNYSGFGRNKIFQHLREIGVLRYNNQPYQDYVERGYFKQIEQEYKGGYDDLKISYKTVISQKGLNFIRKRINEYTN